MYPVLMVPASVAYFRFSFSLLQLVPDALISETPACESSYNCALSHQHFNIEALQVPAPLSMENSLCSWFANTGVTEYVKALSFAKFSLQFDEYCHS